ncbi:MAG: ADP-ribosylglycohydrolase family protein, partial [Muribaculaceae bacterium]|nr:ADP-ribosylglycohydrolase family protein [Muribaculaceae bacterium]
PQGLTFDNGRLTGTPAKAGRYDITLSLTGNGKTLTKDFNLIVKPQNLAMKADTIYTNVRELNEAVLDSCWITFGKPMYAKTVDVINDGVKKGAGSVFYSLASASNQPKIDYFGYGWKEPVAVNMIELNTGCLEEFGGWFSSLSIQYLDEEGRWRDVGHYTSTPALPATDIVFFQPHFAQFLLEFPEVTTRGIRVLLDTKTQDHWHKYTKKVSNFTSITELGVYDLR